MKNLIFNMNGGLGDNLTTEVPEGLVPFPKPTPPIHPKSSATFLGWGLTPNDSPYEGDTINVNNNMTFYALWDGVDDENKIDFRFKPNGAVGDAYDESHEENEMVTLPETSPFSHPLGYSFKGWGQKANDSLNIKETFADKDKTFYALWENNSGGGTGGSTGYGNLTGIYAPIEGGPVAMKLPITDEDYLLLNPCYIPNDPASGKVSTIEIGATTKSSKERSYWVGQLPAAHKLSFPDERLKYSCKLKAYASSGETPSKLYYDQKLLIAMSDAKISTLPVTGRPGKKFIMWSKQQQQEDAFDPKTYVSYVKEEIWPIYRKGDNAVFTLTINGNNGEDEELVYDPLINEVFYINPTIGDYFTPPEDGMRFVGLATKPNGIPKVCQEILINKDTTLYCIWK